MRRAFSSPSNCLPINAKVFGSLFVGFSTASFHQGSSNLRYKSCISCMQNRDNFPTGPDRLCHPIDPLKYSPSSASTYNPNMIEGVHNHLAKYVTTSAPLSRTCHIIRNFKRPCDHRWTVICLPLCIVLKEPFGIPLASVADVFLLPSVGMIG